MKAFLLCGALVWGTQVLAADIPLRNPGFESGLSDWAIWARNAARIASSIDTQAVHSGRAALRIDHSGTDDWSLQPSLRVQVQPGDLIELSCWVKVSGVGSVTLCASTWSRSGSVVDWSSGERLAGRSSEWQHLRTRTVVPSDIGQLQPRLIGHGPVTVWVDDYAVANRGNLLAMRPSNLPAVLSLRNSLVEVEFHTADATFAVRELRGGRRWVQKAMRSDCLVQSAQVEAGRLSCTLFHAPSGLEVTLNAQLDGEKPELVALLAGQGELPSALQYPHPFVGAPGDYLVVPMNEGISYPVDDLTIAPMQLIAYGGHGICMAFYGVTDGSPGYMSILETPDDASIRIARQDGRLLIAPEWEAQRGQFGYQRQLRWVFFDRGGHVAMAKRYRSYARQLGLVRTLEEKKERNPNVDLLIGAVNIWCWDKEAVPLVQELQAAGIARILWSNQQSPGNVKALNQLGVLTSRYDIYQDVMAPTNFSQLQWIHPDWTTNAWPHDLLLNRSGQWVKGWGVEAKDGSLISCGVLCDRRAPRYARERMPADLAARPYRARFIDTTTASPWHECYHPDHPMTRTESKTWKMELLRYTSGELNLVTGCETGHDAAVPFLHYFEGMLSLGPYRVPDAGRRMSQIWTEVPEVVAKYQLGHAYRLPLWELVFHDCVVAQWYWGDYNNKLPALWDKRDLFNVLYGVPPMFMFTRRSWEENKARFVQSYRNTCPQVRQVGYQEMTDHRFLTPDRAVQQTAFANGITITVNFGTTPHVLPEGTRLEPGAFRLDTP